MVNSVDLGERYALLLPRKLLNPHTTPAKGLIINKLLDNKALVLVEEVWQFKGVLSAAPLSELCFSSGRIKHNNWGWQAIPEFGKDYLMYTTTPDSLLQPDCVTIETLIKKSIVDFQRVYGFV